MEDCRAIAPPVSIREEGSRRQRRLPLGDLTSILTVLSAGAPGKRTLDHWGCVCQARRGATERSPSSLPAACPSQAHILGCVPTGTRALSPNPCCQLALLPSDPFKGGWERSCLCRWYHLDTRPGDEDWTRCMPHSPACSCVDTSVPALSMHSPPLTPGH